MFCSTVILIPIAFVEETPSLSICRAIHGFLQTTHVRFCGAVTKVCVRSPFHVIVGNVVCAVVVVVDEEVMISVAYSEDVRISRSDDVLAAAHRMVMYSSILVHVPDASGVESAAKEMLPLEIPDGEVLCLPFDVFVRHPVPLMHIFVLFACQ